MRVIESDVRRDVALFFQPVAPFSRQCFQSPRLGGNRYYPVISIIILTGRRQAVTKKGGQALRQNKNAVQARERDFNSTRDEGDDRWAACAKLLPAQCAGKGSLAEWPNSSDELPIAAPGGPVVA